MTRPADALDVSVVICSYTEDRWDMLMAAVDSVRAQTVRPRQTIVVVDYNSDLYKRLIFTVSDVVILENTGAKGLSGARNTGVSAATTGIVAFLDDDAQAAPDWLERLTALYDDPDVLAVGGRVDPDWEAGRPGYFAQELDWIVGCSHRGLPKVAAEVRNVIGANMSFRSEVLTGVGGFNTALGRQDTLPLGCEETEICIRAVIGSPGSRIVYEPEASGATLRPGRPRLPEIHAEPFLVRGDFQGPGEQGRGTQEGSRPGTPLRPEGASPRRVHGSQGLADGQGQGRTGPGRDGCCRACCHHIRIRPGPQVSRRHACSGISARRFRRQLAGSQLIPAVASLR